MLLLSLYVKTGRQSFFEDARWVHSEVHRVLGLPSGAIRIGQAQDRRGVYFHYTAVWLFALSRLAEVTGDQKYRDEGIALVKRLHPRFHTPRAFWWKLKEDLSGPEPGYGYGGMDHYDAYHAYNVIDPSGKQLASEIADAKALIDKRVHSDHVDQDLGLGMMLWMASFFPDEPWAKVQRERCLATLEGMWRPSSQPEATKHGQPAGFFSR